MMQQTADVTQQMADVQQTVGTTRSYVLAFDTANEVIAIGVGRLDAEGRRIECVASLEVEACRASNISLLTRVDEALAQAGVSRNQIACVVCGRGPGSFTGVRIAMATAKGMADALGVGLIGVSTSDAVAWGAWSVGVRGALLTLGDAMRKEVYPVNYQLDDAGITRLSADCVIKAQAYAEELAGGEDCGDEAARKERSSDEGESVNNGGGAAAGSGRFITGDALLKYEELFSPFGALCARDVWTPTGAGLLCACEALWRQDRCNPFDAKRHNPAYALPVYTRLSDAEENERIRLANDEARNLKTGVQGGIEYRPMDAQHTPVIADLETNLMGTDRWTAQMIAGELGRKDRSWWMAMDGEQLVGYAGGLIVDGDAQILKVGVVPERQRRGIARELLARVADDARNLGAESCSLEVRISNAGAQAFYEKLGLAAVGTRPRYYSDGEDAVIMQGPLPVAVHDVAGMDLQVRGGNGEGANASESAKDGEGADEVAPESEAVTPDIVRPLILAIESSCDETAASVIDGTGRLLSDVVASQIDFHARFGGVVPEIASRKHIEAICGVCAEALDQAARSLGMVHLGWQDLDSVAVTYAPGLVGALVVGVAYAKGAAWAIEKPFIGVNHLEGHLYANKLADASMEPPAVVSLVSGGNTMLIHMKDWGNYETLGTTIDDATGEAFDKVAKALGLGYPGGPVISKYAADGNPDAIAFPRAMLHSGDYRFSLSGLKTAVITYINQQRESGEELNYPDICASFQQAVVDVQVAKVKTALEETGAPVFCLGGGVAANPALRSACKNLCQKMNVQLLMPPLKSCGDNAGMIALVALDRYNQGKFFDLTADAHAHTNLDEAY